MFLHEMRMINAYFPKQIRKIVYFDDDCLSLEHLDCYTFNFIVISGACMYK